ncbi:MAG: Dyp-type peroxidase family, partial [Arenicella sp.]
HKSQGFGDIGENAPEHWEWGNEDKAHEIHILLMLYAENDQMLEKYEQEQIEKLDSYGLQVMHHFDTESFMHDARKEHFGFTDGIGQPSIIGVKSKEDFPDNEIKLGEFVLGHNNEYDKLPDSPCVPSDMDKKNFLETLPNDLPNTRDLGNNGSFLVFRQLEQDVKAFWEYIEGVVEDRKKAGEDENIVRVASKMVGRWPNGSPMALYPDKSGEPTNIFTYGEKKGFGCPIGAHLHRANPRDTFTDEPEKSIKFVKKNRIARRGRGYGKPVDKNFNPETILETEVTDKRRGLHFLAFNSHLARQFELVQKQWMCNPKFLGLYDEVDPVVGHHVDFEGVKFNEFTEPSFPVRKKSKMMPRFITMKGGAYFFMPGVKAVKFLANA